MNPILLSRDRKKRAAGCDLSSQRLSTISVLVGLLTLTMTNPAVTQEKLLRTLTVTGRGVEVIPTTKAEVRLGVEVQRETDQAVQQEVAQRSTAVVELLRARNDAVLSTLNLTRKDIVGIQINGATPPPPMPMFTGRDVLESRLAETPLVGGEQKVQASVTLQISY